MNIKASDNTEEVPLYVKVPAEIHEFLDEVKTKTKINKSDAVTLVLELAYKYLHPEDFLEMYDDYLLLGRDGLKCPTPS